CGRLFDRQGNLQNSTTIISIYERGRFFLDAIQKVTQLSDIHFISINITNTKVLPGEISCVKQSYTMRFPVPRNCSLGADDPAGPGRGSLNHVQMNAAKGAVTEL